MTRMEGGGAATRRGPAREARTSLNGERTEKNPRNGFKGTLQGKQQNAGDTEAEDEGNERTRIKKDELSQAEGKESQGWNQLRIIGEDGARLRKKRWNLHKGVGGDWRTRLTLGARSLRSRPRA